MMHPASAGRNSQATRKVAWIGTDIPFPHDSGYRIRAFENLKALSALCEVTAVCMGEGADLEQRRNGLAAELPHVRVVRPVAHDIHIRRDKGKMLAALLRSCVTFTPYKIAKFESSRLRDRLAEVRGEGPFDLVWVELATAPYAGLVSTAGTRFVLDQQNVESDVVRSYSEALPRALQPLIYLEYLRTRRFEGKVCEKASKVFCISKDDADQLAQLSGSSERFCVLPPVVAPVALPDTSRRTGIVTFVGQLSWMPNEEAARWFVGEVLPTIRSRIPDVRVQVAGMGLTDRLRAYFQQRGVEALGYVEDIGEVYRDAQVFVAPFLSGGGVRIKMLDAMNAGVPIVATTVGSKGLEVEDGRHLLIADSATGFAEAVCRVLSESGLGKTLASNAKDHLLENHSRDAATEKMRVALDSLWTREPIEGTRTMPEDVANIA